MGSLATSDISKNLENGDVKGDGFVMDVGLIQNQTIGAIIESTKPEYIPKLLSPLTIRDVTFPNRILVKNFLNKIC